MAARQTGARDWAVSPGEILAESLEEREMSQSELARRMGRPIKTINEIVNAKAALTPETALQLELVLGIPASLWVNLEATYRHHLAERQTLERFAGYEHWLKTFPIRDLVQHGLIKDEEPVERQVSQLLTFFGAGSPDAWQERWGAPLAQYRKSASYEGSEHARAAWLRWGEILAEGMTVDPFDAGRLRAVAERVRGLSRVSPIQAAIDEAQLELGAGGVALVVVPEFDGTRLSGAARWLRHEVAIVQLSLRHKTDDHFWFSCMHEIGHILDRPRHDFVDAVDAQPSDYEDAEAEARADAFARNVLLEPAAFQAFVARGAFDATAVRAFAEEQSVAPGIVVGRLQHDGLIPPNRHNNLKRALRFDDL
jgi:HTH-type transcriptional regulator / antitoxin HigA